MASINGVSTNKPSSPAPAPTLSQVASRMLPRAATSVVLNISEGRGRMGDAELARFLPIARGSNAALEAPMDFAAVIGHVPTDEAEHVRRDGEITGRMLSALIKRLRSG